MARLLSAAREQWVVTLALTLLTLLLFNQVLLLGLLANAVAIPWVTLLETPLAMLGLLWAPLWDAAAGLLGLLAVLLQWLARWALASVSVVAAPLHRCGVRWRACWAALCWPCACHGTGGCWACR